MTLTGHYAFRSVGLSDSQARATALIGESFLRVSQAFRPLLITEGFVPAKVDHAIQVRWLSKALVAGLV